MNGERQKSEALESSILTDRKTRQSVVSLLAASGSGVHTCNHGGEVEY